MEIKIKRKVFKRDRVVKRERERERRWKDNIRFFDASHIVLMEIVDRKQMKVSSFKLAPLLFCFSFLFKHIEIKSARGREKGRKK